MTDTMDVHLNGMTHREVEGRRHSRPPAVAVRSAMPAATLLRKCTFTELHQLEVIENGDGILLTGVVRSYYMKQMAQETVRPALAGRRLHNKVVVMPATAGEPVVVAPRRVVILPVRNTPRTCATEYAREFRTSDRHHHQGFQVFRKKWLAEL